MKRFWRFFWGAMVATLAATYYLLFIPKIGRATPTEIDAAIPAALKVTDPPDPEGERRFLRLCDIGRSMDQKAMREAAGSYHEPIDWSKAGPLLARYRPLFDRIDALLKEGDLRFTGRKLQRLNERWIDTQCLQLLFEFGIEGASHRPPGECLRLSLLGLRFAEAHMGAKGVLSEQQSAIRVEIAILQAIVHAEMEGGYSASERAALEKVLAKLPKGPPLTETVRRQFQQDILPILLQPQQIWETRSEHANRVGTFDPIATAKLSGQFYEATVYDAEQPLSPLSLTAQDRVDKAVRWLPMSVVGDQSFGERCLLNAFPNSLGIAAASLVADSTLSRQGAKREAVVGLVRTFLILRSGGHPTLPDPFGTGHFRVDPKRRLIWSVGQNMIDDSGQIDTAYLNGGLDMGIAY